MYGEYMYGGEQVNVHKVIIGSDYKGGIGFPDTLSVSCVVEHVLRISCMVWGTKDSRRGDVNPSRCRSPIGASGLFRGLIKLNWASLWLLEVGQVSPARPE